MSVPTDDPNFLQSLSNGLTSGIYSPLMGLAAGLLQAGGPSRMPVSLGQALGAGLQTGQQFQQAGLQNQMQRLMLGRTSAQMQMLQDALSNPMNQQPQQSPQQTAPTSQAVPQDSGIGLFTSGGGIQNALMNPSNTAPNIPQNAVQNMPYTQQGPQSVDPYQDPVYLRNQKLAQVMDMMQPGSGAGYASAAAQRIDYLTKERPGLWQTVAPTDYDNYGLPAQKPGITWERNTQNGEFKPTGESTLMDTTSIDPLTGMMVHQVYDAATKKYVTPAFTGGSGVLPPSGPTVKAPNGTIDVPPQYQAQAQSIARYEQDMPKSYGRNPILGANMTKWVKEFNPDWSEGNFEAKNAVLKSAAGGKDANTLDAFNTIQSHLTTLQQAWGALQNGDIQTANKLANWSGMQFGKSAQSNAQIVNTLVSRELAKVLAAGGQTTEGDKKEANDTLNTYMSQNQQLGAIKYIQSLIGGKTNSIVTRFKANHLTDGDIKARFDPAAWQAYQDFNASQPQTSGNPSLSGSGNDPLGIR